jgi:hypothetical protein
LVLGAVFFAVAGAFLAAGDFLADAAAVFFGAAAAFFAGAAGRLVVVAAFFTTGTAFFFVGVGRFVAVAPTLAEELLFPAFLLDLAGAAEIVRDAGTRLAWVPLLAGVIVPSFGPRGVTPSPDDLAQGAGDDTGGADGRQ